MGLDAPWHWIILAGLLLLTFGYTRLPDASRSLGQSLRIFKREINGCDERSLDGTQLVNSATPGDAAAAPVPHDQSVIADAPAVCTTARINEP